MQLYVWEWQLTNKVSTHLKLSDTALAVSILILQLGLSSLK